MARQKITTRLIKTLKSRAERESRALLVWDEETRGFGCRVAPSGQVSWLVQKWQGGRGGKAQRYTFKAKDLTTARTEAERVIGEVRNGVDLPNRRRQQRTAKREALNAPKLSVVLDLYLTTKAKKRRPGYLAEIKRKFEVEIIGSKPPKKSRRHKPKPLGDLPVTEITKADVRSLIDAKRTAGQDGAARYLFAALNAFFNWCVEEEIIAASPMKDLVAPEALDERERVLSPDEIASFWSATDDDFLFGAFYKLLLLTAQRREEVGAMQWQEIDFKKAEWIIPGSRTKNGETHIVPLSTQALAILEELSPQTNGYVFTTTGKTPISGYGRAKQRLDKHMGVSDWRVHDLRRTATTIMAELGFDPHVVDAILNHKNGTIKGVARVYNRYEYLPEKRRALDAWGKFLECLTQGKTQPSNIITLNLSIG